MRYKRGKKAIGKPKRRSKKQLKAKVDSAAVNHDHGYSFTAPEPEHLSSHDIVVSNCGYSGEFKECMCIVHYDETLADNVTPQTHNIHDHADEYFLILGSKSVQYKDDADIDHLILQKLKEDALIHESELNKLNFEVLKTTEHLHLVQVYEKPSINVKVSLSIDVTLIPTIKVHGKLLPSSHSVKILRTFTFNDLLMLAKTVSELNVCYGNCDDKFISMYSSKGSAYLENNCGAEYSATIRSNCCELLTDTLRCVPCQKVRVVYRNKQKRICSKSNEKNSVDILTSSRPNCSLSRADLEEKQRLLKVKTKDLELQNKRLRNKIQLEIEKRATELSAKESSDFESIITDCTPQVEENFEPSSFQRIFWDEQIKYNKLRNKCSMRWHPLIIKWALLLKSKSSKAYQTMKESGFINLPSERTLYDYSHYVPSKMGFIPETIEMLMNECHQKDMYNDNEPWKKYVGILQDEMKVKSDLVFCPATGELVGYVNLDETQNQIIALQNGLNNSESELATSTLVLMVRGATTDLKYPLAAFSTNGLDANQLYTILWRAVELLELDVGLKVLFITCDGAGQNRKFFDMHRSDDANEPVNCCPNPFAADDRMLYFISDAPHLLKTTRNCFANSGSHKKSRHLWNNGHDISWLHIVKLYEEHIESNVYTKCNLNRSHIDLTSYSQMKVNLAAQVLSNRVATQLEQEYGEKVTGTVEFIRHFNKFFDCVNTRNLYEGKNKRNPDLDAYKDVNDERLSWLTDSFLRYFDMWSESVKNRHGDFSKEEQVKMQLSQQTLDGLKISVRSIVDCVRFLLNEGAPFVLTEVFNQDLLEQHFGHYRHKGGANDNPTIDVVRHTINTLRVVGSSALAPLRGNTKRRRTEIDKSTLNTPLPRKKSRPSSV